MFRSVSKLRNLCQPVLKEPASLLAILLQDKGEKKWFSCGSSLNGQEKLAVSYTHGVSIPLLKKTICDLLDETTNALPDNEAVVSFDDNRRLSYAEFQAQVDQLAASLLGLGLEKGDRVGVWGQNHMEWILAFYAIVNAGLIAVNINPAYKTSELEYALNKVKVKAMFMLPSFKTTDYYDILRDVAPEIEHCQPGMLNAEKVPSLKHVVMTEGSAKLGTFSFTDLFHQGGFEEQQALKNIQQKMQFDDPVNIQFTSGTTGNPKGALLTHHNVVNNGYIIGKSLRYDESTKICISVPLYHCFGVVLGSMAAIATGATQVYPARGFNPESSMRAIHHERCTSVYGTPAMFIDKLNHPHLKQYDFTSLETGIMAGSPCPIEVMRQVIEKLHVRDMTIAYGLTETSPVITNTKRNAPVHKRVSTVGEAFPNMEIKLVDSEGQIVPINETGELCCRGHCVFPGYWDDEDKTKEVIDSDGWFHSGDLAQMEDDGYIKIVGRSKDMVIRGGENIYPTEIENFLYKHPKVEDVQVVGVPDPRMGEEVCACIKLKSNVVCTEEEIKSFCKGKISHYKIPRYIEFVQEYPMTVTGKIKKFVIREEMIEILKQRSEIMNSSIAT